MTPTRGDIRLGGRRLRWVEAGRGEPVLILASGAGDPAAVWSDVVPLLADRWRVVAYDRAGLGESDPMPELPTIPRQLDDLEAVVAAVSPHPCLLVGQSFGGLLVQLLARRRPDLAAGLVLVDPAHEDMLAGIPQPVRRAVGVVAGLRATFTDPAHARAVRRESAGFRQTDETWLRTEAAGLREARFGGLPVAVLSAGQGAPRRIRAQWTERQAEVAAASPSGRHTVVADSGHAIHRERPDLVAEAVRWVISEFHATA